jgi:hypothetical protein
MYNSGNSSKNVTGSSIVDGTVETVDIADNAVTVDKIADLTYDDDTTAFIANTLASGAIIEKGSNANGRYIKYADGTMICENRQAITMAFGGAGSLYRQLNVTYTFPVAFTVAPNCVASTYGQQNSWVGSADPSTTTLTLDVWNVVSATVGTGVQYIAIGRWK